MSRPGTNELRPGWGDPRLNQRATDKEARNSQGDEPQLTKDEIAEVQWQSKEVTKEVKKQGQSMVLMPAMVAAYKMCLYTWGS